MTKIGISDWYKITQDLVNQYATLTGDHQWIHVDVDRALRELPDTGTIAHGLFLLSLCPTWIRNLSANSAFPIIQQASKTLNYGYNKIRFITPVPVGSEIRGIFDIKDVIEDVTGTNITYLITIEIKDQYRPAVVAELIIRYVR
jgi:acyl dehydratase